MISMKHVYMVIILSLTHLASSKIRTSTYPNDHTPIKYESDTHNDNRHASQRSGKIQTQVDSKGKVGDTKHQKRNVTVELDIETVDGEPANGWIPWAVKGVWHIVTTPANAAYSAVSSMVGGGKVDKDKAEATCGGKHRAKVKCSSDNKGNAADSTNTDPADTTNANSDDTTNSDPGDTTNSNSDDTTNSDSDPTTNTDPSTNTKINTDNDPDTDKADKGIPTPSKPTITDATATSFQVHWKAVSNNHDNVQGYILQYRKQNEPFQDVDGIVQHDDTVKTYHKRIEDLEIDTEYFVHVIVTDNENKMGTPSHAKEAHTLCQPPSSPPQDINVNAKSSHELRIDWKAPPADSWHCSKITYDIEYREGKSAKPKNIQLDGKLDQHVFKSEPYTTWTITMRTKNSAGHSPWSDEFEMATPESAPDVVKNLKGHHRGTNRIQLNWDPPEHPNGVIQAYMVSYRLVKIADCDAPDTDPIMYQVSQANDLLKNLNAGCTYEIKVQAKNSFDGTDCDPILVTTEESAPTGSPMDISMVSLENSIVTLIWKAPECEKRNGLMKQYEYELECLDAQLDTMVDTINEPPLKLTNLQDMTKYRFRVRAVNDKGSAPDWTEYEFTTNPNVPPSAEALKTEKATQTSLLISFLSPHSFKGTIDSYRAQYRIRNSNTDWQEGDAKTMADLDCKGINTNSKRLCVEITGLTNSTMYETEIIAHADTGDWGVPALHVEATLSAELPKLAAPPKVTGVKTRSITIEWLGFDLNDMQYIDGFAIEYAEIGKKQAWIARPEIVQKTDTVKANTYRTTIKDLQPNTPYEMRIRAVSKSKRGDPSEKVEKRTLCGKPSTPPLKMKAKILDFFTVQLSWQKPPKTKWFCSNINYIINYTNSTTSNKIIVPVTTTNFKFSSQPGTWWKFQMRTQTLDENDMPGESSDLSTPAVEVTIPPISTVLQQVHSCNVTKYLGVEYKNGKASSRNPLEPHDFDGCVGKCLKHLETCVGINFYGSTNTCAIFTKAITNVQNLEAEKDNYSPNADSVHGSIVCDPIQPSPVAIECGVQAQGYEPDLNIQKRILGGDPAKKHAWPWQVAIIIDEGLKWKRKCGGILIHDNENEGKSSFVVTSAQCVTRLTGKNNEKLLKYAASSVYVVAGDHHKHKYDVGEQHSVAQLHGLIVHPKFELGDNNSLNDIALIKLKWPFNFTATVRPACLAKSGSLTPDTKTCVITGWGYIDVHKAETDVLQQVKIHVHSDHTCGKRWGKEYKKHEMICAGDGLEKDFLGVDQGGPLQCKQDNHHNKWIVYGVASFEMHMDRRSERKPGVYTRVSHYESWIRSEIRKLS